MSRFACIGADAPRELILAAGLKPTRLSGGAKVTVADLPENLAQRSRSLAAQLLDPKAGFVGAVIAHGCTEDIQLFAVLRELARNGWATPFPIFFVDLLHGPGERIARYNNARLVQFQAQLEDLTKAPITEAALRNALIAENRRKTQATALFAARASVPPTLAGVDALRLIRALSGEDVQGALAAADAGCALPGRKRLLITGSPHEDETLYGLIEAAGAVIVGEDHDWGDLWLEGLADEIASPLAALAARPQTAPFAGPTRSSAERARALAKRAEALKVDAVIHCRIAGDEASPWDLKTLREAMVSLHIPVLSLTADLHPSPPAAAELQATVSRFLAGEPEAALAPRPARPAANGPAANGAAVAPGAAAEDTGRRSRKSLACTQDFSAWQRAWFAQMREKAAQGPFAVVSADAPQEILRAMDIPYVVNQWWASIVAAKQKARDYGGLLKAAGYPNNVEPYSAQGLAAALDPGGPDSPWGGLPRPDILGLVTNTDAGPKLYEAWAALTGARLDVFERSVESRWAPPIEWWDEIPARWSQALEPERLDLMTAQLEDHVATLEAVSGRTLDRGRLVEVMTLVNEQEDYYRRTRDLIAATKPAPIGVVDSMPATMTPQWHRGSAWGRDAAKRLFEEVSGRVEAGEAACEGEKLRLMWVGRGLWSDMGFYQRWEQSHGAVFVWSMYLGLAADGYIRAFEGEHDVMRALAARFLTMGDELRMPTWAGAWHVKEAKLHGVHGAVAIDDADPLVIEALERAGVPVCRIAMNNMAASGSAAEEAVSAFIDSLASAV